MLFQLRGVWPIFLLKGVDVFDQLQDLKVLLPRPSEDRVRKRG